MGTVANQPDVITAPPARGWIFYDGGCGMCRHSATRFDARLRRMGYDILPIQTPWVAEKIGREIAENPKEMLLLTPDGKLFGGADAYLQMARQFWWTRWLVPIGNFRPVHFVLEKIYQWIARHRHGISDRCGLK